MVRIEAIFVGEPKNITDEEGTWLSAIYRSRVQGAIELLDRGWQAIVSPIPSTTVDPAKLCVCTR